jgi:hypothetical protein
MHNCLTFRFDELAAASQEKGQGQADYLMTAIILIVHRRGLGVTGFLYHNHVIGCRTIALQSAQAPFNNGS